MLLKSFGSEPWCDWIWCELSLFKKTYCLLFLHQLCAFLDVLGRTHVFVFCVNFTCHLIFQKSPCCSFLHELYLPLDILWRFHVAASVQIVQIFGFSRGISCCCFMYQLYLLLEILWRFHVAASVQIIQDFGCSREIPWKPVVSAIGHFVEIPCCFICMSSTHHFMHHGNFILLLLFELYLFLNVSERFCMTLLLFMCDENNVEGCLVMGTTILVS